MAQKSTIIEKAYFLKVATLFVFAFLFLVPGIVGAASLYISPSSGLHSVGSTFGISVYVSSNDQAMNAASGVLSFPQDKLEITSISKAGSIMGLWVEEPSFSNTLGTATFEGIVLNPGFTGSAGKIVSATFRVKAAGIASVAFASGSILANDGKGTNILTSLGDALFTLGVAPSTPTPAPTPTSILQPSRVGVPSAPVVRSSTHPDQEKWYSSSGAVFSWDVPSGVDAVRLLVGESPSSVPSIVYIPPISSRDLSDISLTDGLWYFHVQLRNNSGWGGTSHFRFQIDTVKPEYFNLQEQARADATYPKAAFVVDATDTTSGIDHYEFQIDEKQTVVWKDDGKHLYQTAPLAPGEHRLIARVVDKAGNYLVDSITFNVEALKSPTFIDHPNVVKTGESFLVKGTTYPRGLVTLWLQRGKEDVKLNTATANKSGIFTFAFEEGLKESGSYKMWAEVIDERGARSLPTEKVSLQVERSALIELGSWATTVLAVIVPIVALVLLLVGLLWYGWQKFMSWRGRIRKEVREADRALHKAIDMLKEDMASQIQLLKNAKSKRKFTKEEEKIITQLKKDLDEAEKFVKKEIKDIEEAVD